MTTTNNTTSGKKVITELTPEQLALCGLYREHALKYGLATEHASEDMRPTVEQLRPLIDKVYTTAGFAVPRDIYIVDGPVSLQRKANELMGTTGVFYDCLYGQHDAGYYEFYAYTQEVLGIETPSIYAQRELALQVGWIVTLDEACIVSRRPVSISLGRADAEGVRRLHSVSGPAIEYGDGTRVYSVNGTVFSEQDFRKFFLAAGPITGKDVLSISNVSQRLQVIKHIGMDKLLEGMPYTVLDAGDTSPGIGRLLEVEIAPDVKQKFYQMQNPSVDEVHLEAVDNGCLTSKEAIMWRNFGDAKRPFVAPSKLT